MPRKDKKSIFDMPIISYEHLNMHEKQREFFNVPFKKVGTIKVVFTEARPMHVRNIAIEGKH